MKQQFSTLPIYYNNHLGMTSLRRMISITVTAMELQIGMQNIKVKKLGYGVKTTLTVTLHLNNADSLTKMNWMLRRLMIVISETILKTSTKTNMMTSRCRKTQLSLTRSSSCRCLTSSIAGRSTMSIISSKESATALYSVQSQSPSLDYK